VFSVWSITFPQPSSESVHSEQYATVASSHGYTEGHMVKASMMITIGSKELVIISQGTCTAKEVGIIPKATEGTELGGAWGDCL